MEHITQHLKTINSRLNYALFHWLLEWIIPTFILLNSFFPSFSENIEFDVGLLPHL